MPTVSLLARRVIWPVEGDRDHWEAPKAFLGLLGQPLACLLPEHAFPRSAVRPYPTVTQVGLAPKASGTKPQAQCFVRCPWAKTEALEAGLTLAKSEYAKARMGLAARALAVSGALQSMLLSKRIWP